MEKFLNIKINLSQFYVLPRAETKFWVKKVIKEIETKNKKLKTKYRRLLVLDLFSGTGFIGIAILKDCPEFCRRVDFGDIDKKALQQIKINLKLNKISLKRVKIIQTDIFSGIKGKYDLILANPPYVAKERLGEVQLSVKKYEPKTAWYGKKGGLFYIEKFLSKAKNFLKENGIIYLEIDTQQKKYIEDLLRRYEYPKFTFGKDQFGKYRWVKIIKTP